VSSRPAAAIGVGERLPHIDGHAVDVAAAPEVVWGSLLRVVEGSFGSTATARFARLLGCTDVEVHGPRPLDAGSTFPGFHIEAARRPHELTLAGSHRFSDYALIFKLDEPTPGHTRIHAETRALFPGLKGRIYRALVIGTRSHALLTRRLLAAVKHRVER
jgi:hypothetical protein